MRSVIVKSTATIALLITLLAPFHVVGQEQTPLITQTLLKRFNQSGYEFGWTGGSATDRGGHNRAVYHNVSAVTVDGDHVEMKYAWHHGILSGSLKDDALRGNWSQDNGKGQFELSFDHDLRAAHGWWKDESSANHHKAFLRAAHKELSQYHFGAGAGEQVVPTGQSVEPAGNTLAYNGRPLDMVLSPDSKTVFVKGSDSVLIVDALKWEPLQVLSYPAGEAGSMHGLAAVSNKLYVTGSHKTLLEASKDDNGQWSWTREIALSSSDSHPCGVVLNVLSQL